MFAHHIHHRFLFATLLIQEVCGITKALNTHPALNYILLGSLEYEDYKYKI